MNGRRSILFFALLVAGGCGGSPTPVPDSIKTMEDGTIEFDVLANDRFPEGRAFTAVIVGLPAHGTATVLERGKVRYTPEVRFHGTDRFEYRIGVDDAAWQRGVVLVEVTHVNHAPAAVDDTIVVREGASFEWNLAAKATDHDGDPLTVTSLQSPTNGTVVKQGQVVVYTPASRFYGGDSFRYAVSDGSLASAPATVNVRVLPAPPRFWRTEQDASLDEMLQEPGSSIYGTSINIWAYKGADGLFDEVIETGHADSSTCRNISGLVYNAFLQKHREPEDLLVAGTQLLKRRVDSALLEGLEKKKAVQDYLAAQDDLYKARLLLRVVEKQPATPEQGKSAIASAKEEVARQEEAYANASKADEVREYLKQSTSQIAMSRFVEDASRIAGETGLVRVHRLDSQIATEAKKRIEDALKAGRGTDYVRFDDLAKKSPDGKAVVIVPVTRLTSREPLVLTLPLAALDPKALEKAMEESRQEITFAMVGNAKSRQEYLGRKKANVVKELEDYQKYLAGLSATKRVAERSRRIILGLTITPDGEFKSEREDSTTLGEYIDFRLPANIRLIEQWIADTSELLDAISKDAKEGDRGAIDHIAYCTMVDSMLREWNLPVSKSQLAFDRWRKAQREPVWDALDEMLESSGIKKDAINGENVVFSIGVDKDKVEIRPQHIVDLKNSVFLIDQHLGVTRVVDTWGERTLVKAASLGDGVRDRVAREAIVAMHAALQASDLESARRHWTKALESNARVAVESLLNEWSSEFPANTALRERLRAEIAPRISAQEMFAEWQRINSDPRYKESDKQGEYLSARHRFLEANPGAPVEMHLVFLLDLALWISEFDESITHNKSTSWDVVDRLTGPSATLDELRRQLDSTRAAGLGLPGTEDDETKPSPMLSPEALATLPPETRRLLEGIGTTARRPALLRGQATSLESLAERRGPGEVAQGKHGTRAEERCRIRRTRDDASRPAGRIVGRLSETDQGHEPGLDRVRVRRPAARKSPADDEEPLLSRSRGHAALGREQSPAGRERRSDPGRAALRSRFPDHAIPGGSGQAEKRDQPGERDQPPGGQRDFRLARTRHATADASFGQLPER